MENGWTVRTWHLERINILTVDFFNASFDLHVCSPTNQKTCELIVTIIDFNLRSVLKGKAEEMDTQRILKQSFLADLYILSLVSNNSTHGDKFLNSKDEYNFRFT